MSKKLFLAGAGAIAVAVALVSTQIVFAHSRPIRFDPPPGTVLTAAPAQVTGWFTQPLRRDPSWNFLQVSDAQGARVDQGDIILSADRKQMSVNLRPGLGEGRYLVTWRTWDDNDGRIFGDCYTFFVGQAAADAAVAANARMDGGGTCQRIDISGTNGTPVAGGTPQAGTTPEPEHDDEEATHDEAADPGGDNNGVPVWSLIVGIVAGVVAGGVGGKLLGARS